MRGTATIYAVVAETSYYGPEYRRTLRAITHDPLEALRLAKKCNPDYDPVTGCYHLAHNQASATMGRVYPVMSVLTINELLSGMDHPSWLDDLGRTAVGDNEAYYQIDIQRPL